MAGKKIRISTYGGRIRIISERESGRPDAAREAGFRPQAPQITEPGTDEAGGTGPASGGLALTADLIRLMEIRAEGVFRPNEPDFEVIYALSGSEAGRLDMLHQMASNEVVSDATPVSIRSSMQRMVEHIRQDRESDPGVIVELHTHPSSNGRIGVAEPSPADSDSFGQAAGMVQEMVPGAKVCFGIHAVGEERIRSRSEPRAVGRNGVRWASITRDHEIRFFDEDSRPVRLALGG